MPQKIPEEKWVVPKYLKIPGLTPPILTLAPIRSPTPNACCSIFLSALTLSVWCDLVEGALPCSLASPLEEDLSEAEEFQSENSGPGGGSVGD